MLEPRLNLIVLRVADIDRSASFYSQLGLAFQKHFHGTGSIHCSAQLAGIVFELYPASVSHSVTSSVRIGFEVGDIANSIKLLLAFEGCRLMTPVSKSEWGLRAVIADWDGHRVELTQAVPTDSSDTSAKIDS